MYIEILKTVNMSKLLTNTLVVVEDAEVCVSSFRHIGLLDGNNDGIIC